MFVRKFGLLRLLVLVVVAAAVPAFAADPASSSSDQTPAATKDASKDLAQPAAKEKDAADDEIRITVDNDEPTAKKPPPLDAAAKRKAEAEYFELYMSLADTVDQIERNYVKPIDRRELMEAAIKGMLSKLDPYSNYISPEEISSFRTAVENQFGGVGIQIAVDEGQLRVISPLVGTPAYKAGVQAGDRIIKIDGEPTKNLALDDAVRKLKGEIGTSVTLTVQHPRTAKEETFNLTREMVHVDTVMGDSRKADDSWDFMLDKDKKIGVIRITSFSRETEADLRKALEQLKDQKARGLVLDLRFNPGGLLTTAIAVCDMFIPEGKRIVSTKGRNTPERVWDAQPGEKFTEIPMVVLVNHYSASASEIVSACLQDHKRAIVVGERTWGKGSVQNVVELEEGHSALKLTTATYSRPNGHNIHRFPDAKETDEWGVKPSEGFQVTLNNAEMAALLMDRHDRDIVLAKARTEGSAKGDADSEAKISVEPARPDAEEGGEKGKSAGKKSSSRFIDRQLQKAIDYLTTELARSK